AAISLRRRSRTARTASAVATRPSRSSDWLIAEERRTSSTDGSCRSQSVFFTVTLVFDQMLSFPGNGKHLLQLVAMATAHLQPRAILQDQQVIAALQSMRLFHALEVHDGAAMNASELLRIESLRNRVDGGTNAEHLSGRMNVDVVGCGGKIVNVRDSLEENSALGPNHNFLGVLARRLR